MDKNEVIKLRKLGLSYKDIWVKLGNKLETFNKKASDKINYILKVNGLTNPALPIVYEPIDNEIWKPILIQPPYEISNFGRIRNGNRLLKPQINTKGYSSITIRNKPYEIHRLVAKTFINPNLKPKDEVNHKDFNRLNPSLNNLEIVSRRDNILYTVNNKRNLNHVPDYVVDYIYKQLSLNRHDLNNIIKEIYTNYGIKINSSYICKIRRKKSRYDIHSRYNVPIPNKVKTVSDSDVRKICKYIENHKGVFNSVECVNTLKLNNVIKNPSKYLNKLVIGGKRKNITKDYNLENYFNKSNSTTRARARIPKWEEVTKYFLHVLIT